MAMISELYFKMSAQQIFEESKIIEIAKEKATQFNLLGISVADFGTRRRYSFENHNRIINTLKTYGKPSIMGTSNIYFAKKYDLIPIGTHAHEWFMFHAAKYGYKMANKLALEHWVRVYRGDLGIALSDTFTTDVFFRSFDTKFAKLFDGVRQDSGDPIIFAEKTIEHYKNLRIDPLAKTIIFSDGLNPQSVEEIAKFCRNKIKISFGIGTNFTNDVGVTPLNIVIKIVEAKAKAKIGYLP
jgi:nicotinate phosphoribosyltransferase